jgi:hypothetical protein
MRNHDWRMENMRRIVPISKKPHIGCDVHESAQPDRTDVLRSEVSCATSLMIDHMMQPKFFAHNICPVSCRSSF